MGRFARGMLATALADPAWEVTFLFVRARDATALAAQFPASAVCGARSARRPGRHNVVWYPFNGMPFRAAAPTLVTIHDAFAFTEPHRDRIARWREQRPIRRAAKEATRVCTDSDWSRNELLRALALDPARVSVVRPAPEPFWFPAPDDGLPASVRGRRYVLLVGAREPRKNAGMLIRACAEALHGPDEMLVVVGRLPPEERRSAMRLSVEAGEVADASDGLLRALYRNAAVVAVPSTAEGFGLVAAEALACGTAVLAADSSALPEATAGAALLLDPYDRAAWARALREVLDDPAHAQRLRARAAKFFAASDPTRPARELLALLRRLALSE